MRPIPAAALAAALLTGLGATAVGAGMDLDAAIGERLFRRAWVPAQSSTRAADGLGPLFNARACSACHGGLARAAARAPDALDRGLTVRLGDEAGRPDPVLGRQIQSMAASGVEPESRPVLAWRRARVAFAGRAMMLERPVVTAPLQPGMAASLRAAPALRGLGALAQVPEARILAIAEEQARSGDGVAGRPHRLADGRIGRFGWKASAADLDDQVADAFALDMGLSSARRPAPWGDCTERQAACRAAPHGVPAGAEAVEMDEAIVTRLAGFLAAVERPAPGPADPAGAALFAATGCGRCHRADLPSAAVPAFTDLLLHDMGDGLDDGVGAGAARGRDWRTAPLAGLGAALGAGLLHDGRARSIEAAVAWHGGEAAAARGRFFALPAAERVRLVRYLGSL